MLVQDFLSKFFATTGFLYLILCYYRIYLVYTCINKDEGKLSNN